MITLTILGYTTGATLYAFPVGQSLASWSTYRVLFTEGSGANAGRYTASVIPASGTQWVVFVGATQPASWADAVPTLAFDVASEFVKMLAESDQILEDVAGVQKLKTYQRGTSTELLTAKTAKQPGGANLTDPATQRLAGYRE